MFIGLKGKECDDLAVTLNTVNQLRAELATRFSRISNQYGKLLDVDAIMLTFANTQDRCDKPCVQIVCGGPTSHGAVCNISVVSGTPTIEVVGRYPEPRKRKYDSVRIAAEAICELCEQE
jgi:hypothetical protein